MTDEGTARGRCQWQRPLVVLDPSLLQIDDADRAALGGGFHGGQVRRAGLAVDLRQPSSAIRNTSGQVETHSPQLIQSLRSMETSMCIAPFTR